MNRSKYNKIYTMQFFLFCLVPTTPWLLIIIPCFSCTIVRLSFMVFDFFNICAIIEKKHTISTFCLFKLSGQWSLLHLIIAKVHSHKISHVLMGHLHLTLSFRHNKHKRFLETTTGILRFESAFILHLLLSMYVSKNLFITEFSAFSSMRQLYLVLLLTNCT